MYQRGLALNELQWSICYKTKQNQTILSIVCKKYWLWKQLVSLPIKNKKFLNLNNYYEIEKKPPKNYILNF